jgi:hypothetical protein
MKGLKSLLKPDKGKGKDTGPSGPPVEHEQVRAGSLGACIFWCPR